jgi:hypothetical protein
MVLAHQPQQHGGAYGHLRSRKHYKDILLGRDTASRRSVSYSSQNITSRGAQPMKTSPLTLVDEYSGKNFFDGWDFFDFPDPTHGNVDYVGSNEAFSAGLVSVGDDNVVTIAVDDTNTVPPNGNRKSVRISSKKRYTGGLFVMDLNAMPSGCATWPSFWTVAPDNWPQYGEIDIIEGVNTRVNNQMTLHTRQGCTLDVNAPPKQGASQAFTGKVLGTNCDALANSNAGCGVLDTTAGSYGAGVQAAGGGVFAMVWDEVGIRTYHFPRNQIPPDLSAKRPNPSTWPVPQAFWSSETCDVDSFFEEHEIVINTTLCGDFASAVYSSDGCPDTCAKHVEDPNNFKNAKWKINYVAVYQ